MHSLRKRVLVLVVICSFYFLLFADPFLRDFQIIDIWFEDQTEVTLFDENYRSGRKLIGVIASRNGKLETNRTFRS